MSGERGLQAIARTHAPTHEHTLTLLRV